MLIHRPPGSLGFSCSFSVLSSQRVPVRLFFRWAWVLRFRGVSFFRGIVLEPVLAHQSLLWLSCSYPGWLLASLAFVSGCSFGSVGVQASVCFALPTSFGFSGSNFFRLNLFPLKACPSPPFSCPTSLSCCPSSFNFPLFTHVVGSLLSLLDLCITLKKKIPMFIQTNWKLSSNSTFDLQ